jgi:AcrR family transcriptional regulator
MNLLLCFILIYLFSLKNFALFRAAKVSCGPRDLSPRSTPHGSLFYFVVYNINQVLYIVCYIWFILEGGVVMPPKKRFSREQIVDAAFEIAKVNGMDGITIRKVAERLKSSIAPIYVNFEDVEELKLAVVKRIVRLSNEILMEVDTGKPFHDIGVASLRFAREYSVLFQDFISNQSTYLEHYDQEMGRDLMDRMKEDSELEGFTEDELRLILLKMRIFSVGLSVMVANNLLPPSFSEEDGVELLASTAIDVVTSARLKNTGGA